MDTGPVIVTRRHNRGGAAEGSEVSEVAFNP